MFFGKKIKVKDYLFKTEVEKVALNLVKKISKYEKAYFVGDIQEKF